MSHLSLMSANQMWWADTYCGQIIILSISIILKEITTDVILVVPESITIMVSVTVAGASLTGVIFTVTVVYSQLIHLKICKECVWCCFWSVMIIDKSTITIPMSKLYVGLLTNKPVGIAPSGSLSLINKFCLPDNSFVELPSLTKSVSETVRGQIICNVTLATDPIKLASLGLYVNESVEAVDVPLWL